MRPKKVDDEEVLKGLMSVLRHKGFEGAKLDDLAEATGLNKASLYNRFPDGKVEMASAILDHVAETIRTTILHTLSDQSRAPEHRLEDTLVHIAKFYCDGKETCILRALSLDSSMKLFGNQIAQSMNNWINGFKVLGLDFGLDEATAKSHAIQVLMLIQGSLVVSNGLSDISPFQQAIVQIRKMYLVK